MTNRQTNRPTIRSLTSADVENCSVPRRGPPQRQRRACKSLGEAQNNSSHKENSRTQVSNKVISKVISEMESSERPKSRKWPLKSSFWLFESFKMPFYEFWTILHDLVMLPNVRKHLVLSQYAISSRSNRPNSRKWPKTSFLALWIIQKRIFVIFDWSFMTCWRCI